MRFKLASLLVCVLSIYMRAQTIEKCHTLIAKANETKFENTPNADLKTIRKGVGACVIRFKESLSRSDLIGIITVFDKMDDELSKRMSKDLAEIVKLQAVPSPSCKCDK